MASVVLHPSFAIRQHAGITMDAGAWSPLRRLACFFGCAATAWGLVVVPVWMVLAG